MILRLRSSDHWRQPFSMCGVQGWGADDHLRFVATAMTDEARQTLAVRDVFAEACLANRPDEYGPIEAEFRYAFVRQHRPQGVVQIGSGVSTAVVLAGARDAGYHTEVTCIDPLPAEFLVEAQRRGQIRLIASPVETLDLEFLAQLTAGDFFIVDSTHTLGPAGEATRIILEMLPRLQWGVFVHFHDIWLPDDFDPRIMGRVCLGTKRRSC